MTRERVVVVCMAVEEARERGREPQQSTRYFVAAGVILLLFVCSAIFMALTTKAADEPPPAAAGVAQDSARIASISAENRLLSYSVFANAAQIQKLMKELESVRGSALASLSREVSTYAVSQSALYSQLKKWGDTEFAGSAVAKLLNRLDALDGGRQMMSAQAAAQQVSSGQNVVFSKIVFNSNSIQNAIELDPANGDRISLQPGSYFITYSLAAYPDATWNFVTVDDQKPVPGSELFIPVHESTAFVIEVRKEGGKIDVAVQTANAGTFNVTFASFVIFAVN